MVERWRHHLTARSKAERAEASSVPNRQNKLPVAVATVLVGGTVLALSLRLAPGDPWFLVGTTTLALTWLTGSWLGGHRLRRAPGHWRAGLVTGIVLLVAFLLGAGIVASIGELRRPVEGLLTHARWGALPLVLATTMANGIAEELFFRGALYDAFLGRRPILVTTIIYTAVTALSGIAMLAFAGAVLGLAMGLLRRRTTGVVPPIIAHLIWSVGMLFLLGPTLDLWRLS